MGIFITIFIFYLHKLGLSKVGWLGYNKNKDLSDFQLCLLGNKNQTVLYLYIFFRGADIIYLSQITLATQIPLKLTGGPGYVDNKDFGRDYVLCTFEGTLNLFCA